MCNFQLITHHISEMVQNRDIVTLEVEQEVVFSPSVTIDPNNLKPPLFINFGLSFLI